MSADVGFLPYGRHHIDDDDVAAVVAVLRSDRLTQGAAIERFEDALTAATGSGCAVSCANGTAALYLACRALDPAHPDPVAGDPMAGDVAIVPTITFLATAAAPRLAGMGVVFADVDPRTGLMRPADVADAIARADAVGRRVRAVLPVHLAGRTVDIDGIADVVAAMAPDATMIEDACHALGGEHRVAGIWGPVGACRRSAMTAFSFHPVKTVAAGEAGAVTTNDPELAFRLRRLRNHGMERDPAGFRHPADGLASDGVPLPWYYESIEPSFNFRLSDIHAALGASQMAKLPAFVARRRALRDAYAARLAVATPWATSIPDDPDCRPAWHLAAVAIDFAGVGVPREEVMRALGEVGIGSQVHYFPVHRQPCWRDLDRELHLPGAETYYARTLSLPLFPTMRDADVDRVVGALTIALDPSRGAGGGG